MTGVEEQKACFAAVTENGARVMHLGGYGLKPGCHADMVVLQAGNVLEALRLKPARLFVIRRGKVIAETPPVQAQLKVLGNEPVDFLKR
jgi:cytosine deaminase